jgi:drug/metabolite transporter (DMT)-like permease
MPGAFWAVGAAVVFSLGHIALRKSLATLSLQIGTAIMLVSGTLLVLVASLLIDELEVLMSASLAGVSFFALAGIVHFVGGWSFMNASTNLVGAARMSAITGVTPLFATFLAISTLKETISPLIGLGIILIVLGAILISQS